MALYPAILVGSALFTLWLYGDSLGYGFMYDDPMDLPRAGGRSFLEIATSAGESSYYRPFVLLVWKALFLLPGFYDARLLHILVLAAQALAGWLVFLLGMRLANWVIARRAATWGERPGPRKRPIWPPSTGASSWKGPTLRWRGGSRAPIYAGTPATSAGRTTPSFSTCTTFRAGYPLADLFPIEYWRPDDWFVERRELSLPPELGPEQGPFAASIGIYSPKTGERLPAPLHRARLFGTAWSPWPALS